MIYNTVLGPLDNNNNNNTSSTKDECCWSLMVLPQLFEATSEVVASIVDVGDVGDVAYPLPSKKMGGKQEILLYHLSFTYDCWVCYKNN